MLTIGRYGTRDVKRAKVFYDGIAELLGASLAMERPDLIGYKGPEGGMLLIGKPFAGEATVGNGVQMAFSAPSRAVIDKVHAKALELGGKCEGPPGERAPGFYAAYFRDLDGNKLAVTHFAQA